MNDQKEITVVPVQEPEKKPKKGKKEKEFRRVKTLSPMSVVIPFIMVDRTGSQNFIQDSVEIEKLEKYMKEKQQGGMTNISMMHIMIAAYIRLVSQRPALNRFIRGQRVWTRKNAPVKTSSQPQPTRRRTPKQKSTPVWSASRG